MHLKVWRDKNIKWTSRLLLLWFSTLVQNYPHQILNPYWVFTPPFNFITYKTSYYNCRFFCWHSLESLVDFLKASCLACLKISQRLTWITLEFPAVSKLLRLERSFQLLNWLNKLIIFTHPSLSALCVFTCWIVWSVTWAMNPWSGPVRIRVYPHVWCRLRTTAGLNQKHSGCVRVCRCEHTHAHTHTRGGVKIKPSGAEGRWGVSAHTQDITSVRRRPVLLTLPFALVGGGRVGGGVVSLGLRRRPFSWPLTPNEEKSLASARFLARSVFHDRDFLYGTVTIKHQAANQGADQGVRWVWLQRQSGYDLTTSWKPRCVQENWCNQVSAMFVSLL